MFISAPSSSISISPSHCFKCHADGVGCSASVGVTSSWIKPSHEVQGFSDHSGIRPENPFLGATQLHWLPVGHEISLSRISVAADYPDSVPDSSNYVGNHGYHPLEGIRDHRRVRDTELTAAETARTTVEANSNALLIFPGMVHCEPHERESWAEFQYVIDEYGDIFFEIYDDKNILQDRDASNPVNALIGMDFSQYEKRRAESSDYSNFIGDSIDDTYFLDNYLEVENSEMSDFQVDWAMPDSYSKLHPVYFAKCLTKAVEMEHAKMMDHPSNGISIWGHLKPAFLEEEFYVRRLFSDDEVGDGYISDWKDGETLSFGSSYDKSCSLSTIYRLEILKIELFSVYGAQIQHCEERCLQGFGGTEISKGKINEGGKRPKVWLGSKLAVNLHDFQDAEPDILVHSTPAIVEWFKQQGIKCKFALKALCRKKGLHAERAKLIGVDSLGMDVRVLSGTEVQTHRFPFKVRATSEVAAEKQIRQLLFPRSRRKKFRTPERAGDLDSL
ncbi:uncharacterized protein At3g49140 isoform X2 [Nicotiana sylvestris]|uniref:Uncharacterized protein At3g49140 isoform X2 n=1 Tax=Nicotiana sylvestris TaxID=4096 RepID=A0A1U7VS43_NICSY|nr:PREDICTED: uncharacterized protein At3g49140 isoform X2 [Nicotiana sylvestris]